MSTWPPNCWDLSGGSQSCSHYNNSAAEASFWNWTNGNNALMTSPMFDVLLLDKSNLNLIGLIPITLPIQTMH